MTDDDELEWRDRAACRDMPVNDFFPMRGSNGAPAQYKQTVRDACDTCPVAPQCLADALHGESHLHHPVLGYRGGKTPEQRLVILLGQGRRISERQAFSRSRRHLVARARQAGVPAHTYNINEKTVIRLAGRG